ncbi:hypothetical protein [Streptomyces venezuelae]|uniref:hypothetical protein n=1 Tax=Streptomyces venezuelae TaxID=54571 RepID=UPI00278C828D|nr:hypothetical protein [Streptomyces venezuelae]
MRQGFAGVAGRVAVGVCADAPTADGAAIATAATTPAAASQYFFIHVLLRRVPVEGPPASTALPPTNSRRPRVG